MAIIKNYSLIKQNNIISKIVVYMSSCDFGYSKWFASKMKDFAVIFRLTAWKLEWMQLFTKENPQKRRESSTAVGV